MESVQGGLLDYITDACQDTQVRSIT